MYSYSKTLSYSSALFIFLFSMGVYADTQYVSDQLEITMRTGPAVKNKINQMLKSGDQLTVLQQNENGYTQVKNDTGKTGWVLQRYLMAKPSARSQADALLLREKTLNTRLSEVDNLSSELGMSEKNLKESQALNKQLNLALSKLKKVSADTIKIHDKNIVLNDALERSEAEQSRLKVENLRLSNNTEQAWFVRGAGVILLGMLLGLLVPKLRFKKKRAWGDFSSYN